MRLLEFEGKELLQRHGVPVPRGWLGVELPDNAPPELVVKAQTFGGGRAKRGGIRFASGLTEAAAALRAMGERLGDGELIHDVLVEERVRAVAELYAAALVDRDRATIRLLVGEAGGVEVEAQKPGSFRELSIEPGSPTEIDLAPLVAGLPLEKATQTRVAATLRGLLDALLEEDAELVEVNPLLVLADGSLVAADAHIVLDDDAAGRHPDRRLRSADLEGTTFERAAAGLGVVGIELGGGDIVFFSNGAGLTMATLDQLLAGGGRVAAMVELHGVIAHGPQRLAAVTELLLGFHPRVLLVNLFYQFRSTRTVAEGLADLLDRIGPGREFDVVARIRGIDAGESANLLAERGVAVAHGFEEACAATLDRSRRRD